MFWLPESWWKAEDSTMIEQTYGDALDGWVIKAEDPKKKIAKNVII
jgi:hypothetical protein